MSEVAAGVNEFEFAVLCAHVPRDPATEVPGFAWLDPTLLGATRGKNRGHPNRRITAVLDLDLASGHASQRQCCEEQSEVRSSAIASKPQLERSSRIGLEVSLSSGASALRMPRIIQSANG